MNSAPIVQKARPFRASEGGGSRSCWWMQGAPSALLPVMRTFCTCNNVVAPGLCTGALRVLPSRPASPPFPLHSGVPSPGIEPVVRSHMALSPIPKIFESL